MTYSATPIIGLYDMDHLSEENVWDEKVDANFKRLEQAIHGKADIVLSGVNVTLNDTPYEAPGESHKKLLVLTGTLAASCSLIVPNKARLYHVINGCVGAGGNPYTVTVRTAAGTGPALKSGEYAVVRDDGANVFALFRSSEVLGPSGGTLTGPLNANAQRITTLPWPGSNNNDAAPVNWVNEIVAQTKYALYPVSHVIFSVNPANPATYLGFGTWVPYGGGTFLMMAGTHTDIRGEYRDYSTTAEKAGGEYQHALTGAETGPHNHALAQPLATYVGGKGHANGSFTVSDVSSGVTWTETTGGGAAHNNVPPYSVLYAWRRTA